MAKDLGGQIAAVRAEMETRPPGLVRHVQRVLTEALDLAARFDVDPQRTQLAVWGHDLFRSFPPDEQLALAEQAGVRIRKADRASPVLLHGAIAAAVLRERFGVRDAEALAAVRDHTLGDPKMPMIAKIMLIADKVETRKRERDPAMKLVRLAARRDLDLALLCWADWKWVEERRNRWQSHPAHWRARRDWVAEHHAGVYPARGPVTPPQRIAAAR